MHRDGLAIALANRHDLSLEPILKFLVKYITNPRHCTLAADVATVVIGQSSWSLSLCDLRHNADSSVIHRNRNLLADSGAVAHCGWTVYAAEEKAGGRARVPE